MVNWVIYKHTSNTSGKSYIGLTKRGVAFRWAQHKKDAAKGSKFKFHAAIRKYGPDDWRLTLLEVGITTLEEAARLEAAYIHMYDTYKNGYNATEGGEGVTGPSKYKDRTYWQHIDEGVVHATIVEMVSIYGLSHNSLVKLYKGSISYHNGWTLFVEGTPPYEDKYAVVREWEHAEYGTVTQSAYEMIAIYGLAKTELCKVLSGKAVYRKGWRLKNDTPIKKAFSDTVTLHHCDGTSKVFTIEKFTAEFGVTRGQAVKVFSGKAKESNGWSIYPSDDTTRINGNKKAIIGLIGDVEVARFPSAKECAKVITVGYKNFHYTLTQYGEYIKDGIVYKKEV